MLCTPSIKRKSRTGAVCSRVWSSRNENQHLQIWHYGPQPEKGGEPTLGQGRVPDYTHRYSQLWNLCLLNLPQHSNEDVRKEVMDIIALIIPEEKNKFESMIETVHKVGRTTDENSSRPIIIQCTMRTFPHKVWNGHHWWCKTHGIKKRLLQESQDVP